MGLLIDGQWHDQWYDTSKNGGHFKRKASSFRHWVTADGSAGSSGAGGFEAASGRYHLYVSLACPWAHRTMIFRRLKGLQDMISIAIVNPFMGDQGWSFEMGRGVVPDIVNNVNHMHQVYTTALADYTGRVTVPVLWDCERKTIVSNESAEIIRMFNTAFDALGAKPGDYYPEPLREQIDTVNALIYSNINNGVYKAGFATTQSAYEKAVVVLFETLEMIEQRLSGQRYLVGHQITEADWRLFTTLIRFDSVYVGHFKCNVKRIQDFPNLSNYLCDLYQVPGVSETVDLESCKQHYYLSHTTINPTGVVPVGPALDYTQAHDRAKFDG